MVNQVTVAGPNHSTLRLDYNQQDVANVAQSLANIINGTIASGASIDSVSTGVSNPTAPAGAAPRVLEVIGPNSNVTANGYKSIVDSALGPSTISSFDNVQGKQILAGSGDVTINANGSGSIVGGDGRDQVSVSGQWNIKLGDGIDTITAGGIDTISSGHGSLLFVDQGGAHTIFGSGGTATLTGAVSGPNDKGVVDFGTNGSRITDNSHTNDTLVAASGSETLNAAQTTGNVRFDFISGNSSVVAGQGPDTFSFANDKGGEHVTIYDFKNAADILELGPNHVVNMKGTFNNVTLTLSDNTTITFSDLPKSLS